MIRATVIRWRTGADPVKVDESIREAGTYYLVVDAKDGAEGNYTLTVEKEIEEEPAPTCETPVDLTVDVPYNGNTADGQSLF